MAAKKSAKSPQPASGKGGAPRQYDRAALTDAICARLETGKEPMTVICADLGVPVKTVNDWRLQDEAIRAQFDAARDLGYDAIAHDALCIADTPKLGVIEKLEPVKQKNGRTKLVVTERRNEDMLGHRKLQVETRLKLLAKWDPRRYGERHILQGDKENPLIPPRTQLTDEQLMAIAARAALEPQEDGNKNG